MGHQCCRAATIPELADLRRLTDTFSLGGQSYLGAAYGGATLTHDNVECVVSDVVDAFVIFVSGHPPWRTHGTGGGPITTFPLTRFPDPNKCPFHSFWLFAEWLDNELRCRSYTQVSYETVTSLSWHPPPGWWSAPKDVVVKLCYGMDGEYWFAVREEYASRLGVPRAMFDLDQYEIIDVLFNGIWARYTERARNRVLGLLLQMSCPAWEASASATEPGGSPNNALDGSAATRWSTGVPQAPGQWFQADLGTTQTFRTIVLNAANSPNDYPRGYEIYVSDNDWDWETLSPIATGTGSGAITTITLGAAVQARYVRLVQTGSNSTDWWSIHEFNLTM